jgi:hypothetical protein
VAEAKLLGRRRDRRLAHFRRGLRLQDVGAHSRLRNGGRGSRHVGVGAQGSQGHSTRTDRRRLWLARIPAGGQVF